MPDQTPDTETHWGADPGHGGLAQHKGTRENCTGPDCLDAVFEQQHPLAAADRVRAFLDERATRAGRPYNNPYITSWHGLTLTEPDLRAVLAELARLRRQLDAAEAAPCACDHAPELEKLRGDKDRLLNCLADVVTKASVESETADGFIAWYLMPTGPIHKAIPMLQDYGLTIRPGFDGRTFVPGPHRQVSRGDAQSHAGGVAHQFEGDGKGDAGNGPQRGSGDAGPGDFADYLPECATSPDHGMPLEGGDETGEP